MLLLKWDQVLYRKLMDIQTKKKLLWAAVLSVVIMAFLLLKVDWDHFTLIADRLNGRDFFLAFLMFILANFVRSLRFKKLDHTGCKLSQWWIVNQIYNLITVTLPGGPGEAAAAYLLKRFLKFNILSAFRIFILTRIMDLAGLSALLLITAFIISKTTLYRDAALFVSGMVFIITVIVAYPKSERYVIRLMQKIPFKGRIMSKVNGKLEEVAKISEERFSAALFGVTMFQSLIMVLCIALSVHFILLSFGAGFTLTQGLYCFGVFGLFQLVPVHGIAGIGTQTAWWSIALSAAGYDAPDAVAIAIVVHATIYLFSAVMGLIAVLFSLGINNPD